MLRVGTTRAPRFQLKIQINPNSEVEKGESTNKRAGARRLRRFTIRKVLDTRKSSAWWTLKRPEGRAPLAVHHSTSVFGLNSVYAGSELTSSRALRPDRAGEMCQN